MAAKGGGDAEMLRRSTLIYAPLIGVNLLEGVYWKAAATTTRVQHFRSNEHCEVEKLLFKKAASNPALRLTAPPLDLPTAFFSKERVVPTTKTIGLHVQC